MNTYEYTFHSLCPNDGDMIEYKLSIQTPKTIMVEDIIDACEFHHAGYQEEIADDLSDVLGGFQVLQAAHQGVRITTQRAGK